VGVPPISQEKKAQQGNNRRYVLCPESLRVTSKQKRFHDIGEPHNASREVRKGESPLHKRKLDRLGGHGPKRLPGK